MARDLADVLADEGAALLAGDFDRLKVLATERDMLLARLTGEPPSDSPRLRQLAARNMRLAESAAKGLQVAVERLAKITRGASLDTYSAKGKRQSFQDPRPNLQRRA